MSKWMAEFGEAAQRHIGCYRCKHFHKGSIEYGEEYPDECAIAAKLYLDGKCSEEISFIIEQDLMLQAVIGVCRYKEVK